MSSIVTAVFKATIGMLVNKGRDKAAEKLKDGDVTDKKFRGLIVREIDDIKSKLDGLSRKDLQASISFFEEGIELLYEVFDKARSRSEYGAVTTQAACAEAFSLAEGMRNVELTSLDESATRALSNAKERFKKAREKATEAFNNEALETSDRILAMQYRVMATILETVDHPADAVAPCRVCIKELNSLSAVQNSFDVQLKKGIQAVRGIFGKDERRKIISSVCHVNRVIYDVTGTIGKVIWIWPAVNTGEEKVDPLRDERVTEILRKQGMEHCSVTTWSFGQGREKEQKLRHPRGITTNSSGQFIVGDQSSQSPRSPRWRRLTWDLKTGLPKIRRRRRHMSTAPRIDLKDCNVKMFDSTGTFMSLFSLPTDDVDTKLYVFDVATDMKDNIYVLLRLEEPGVERPERFVYKFNNTADLHHKFPVRGENWGSLTATDSGKVLVLRNDAVEVYENNGQFVCEFGKDILKSAKDITAANDGRVMVVDWEDSCVHIFSEDGDHLNKFELQGCYSDPRIAFHRASEHVVVASIEAEEGLLHIDIHTQDGEIVRSTQILDEELEYLEGMTVTTEGRIAAACKYWDSQAKVLVI